MTRFRVRIPWRMRMNLWFIICLFMCNLPASAQFFDDFTDGDLANRYLGTPLHFRVNAGELQLNAQVAGASWLAREVNFSDSILWEFYFRLDFDPSASNRLRFWLSSTNEVLENGDGLYLEIGESLNNDPIRLFQKQGNTRTELASGSPGRVAFAPAQAAVRCIYDGNGKFQLLADYHGGDRYSAEFELPLDKTLFAGQRYFGPHCLYTESRRSHFNFRRFKIQELSPDTIPPSVVQVVINSSTRIRLTFNEAIDTNRLQNLSALLIPDRGSISAHPVVDNNRQVDLWISQALQNAGTYQLRLREVFDLAGNILADTTMSIQYLIFEVPDPYDVLFSELMVRPRPAQGLPGEEYIELHNRSDKIFNAADFTILDGTVFRSIDSMVIFPGEFVLIISRAHLNLFETPVKKVGMTTLPSLTDSGKRLALYFGNTLLIDWVQYADNWYRSSGKSSGGFSLELINPLAPCALGSNWIASNSAIGGTPGEMNSVWNPATDTIRPTLLDVYPENNASSLLLRFDKKIDPVSASASQSFIINPLNIVNSIWNPSDPTQITLQLVSPPNPINSYTVTARLIGDCEGTLAGDRNSAIFSAPLIPEPGDIVINEILFQAETGGSRYIELYNNGDFFTDLSTLFIADFSSNTPGRAIDTKRLLAPQAYVAITANPEYIRSRYSVPDTAIVLSGPVPTLSDRSGNVSVYTFNGIERIMVDSVNYSRDFHYPLLADRRGVSIERLDPLGPSSSKNNWYSAAEAVGYGTPGYRNSQRRLSSDSPEDKRLTFVHPFFTPNQDGYRDFLELQYSLEKPGYVANVRIFDAKGLLIRQLASNELLPESGVIIWDGTNQSGQAMRMGIYLVLAELTHPSGDIIRFKKECTLGGILD
jgi:hypothetical protein